MENYFISGGTGTFGTALVRHLLDYNLSERIVIYSRDELKQYELRQKFNDDPRLRWFIGDIRDKERLTLALRGIDTVIHAAALKQVDAAEYNPTEFIKTNIYGTQNVVESSIQSGVQKVMSLSTDKASSPINLYGATKLVSDKLMQSANNLSGSVGTKFATVRYGNVMGSRGSVIPTWINYAALGKPLPITDVRMTRFWISVDEAVTFVLDSLKEMKGGEIFVPKIPSFRIVDLARAVSPTALLDEIGIRPGEKLHEEMVSIEDSRNTIEFEKSFIIFPSTSFQVVKDAKINTRSDEFRYSSDTNKIWLTTEEIKSRIAQYRLN